MTTAFRAAPPSATAHQHLGLLSELTGHWVGHGFNLISRPDHQHNKPFFLELNSTRESLKFTGIGGFIPNRGSVQNDANLHGLHYLQEVSDRVLDSGIHIEPGLWLRVPPTSDPAVDHDTYVRQATIPHGDSVLAQSIFTTTVNGGPVIDPVDSTPFTGAIPGLNALSTTPVTKPEYLEPFATDALPLFLSTDLDAQATIKNPNLVLLDDIKNQHIEKTVVISISSAPVGGIVNIPFVTQNANAAQLDAIFWIETVQHPVHGEFLQLQYVQRVILTFLGIQWPHISVATLHKL